MKRQLVDPRLRASTQAFWPSVCSIQTVVNTVSDSNQPIRTGQTPVPSLQRIPCRLGPLSETSVADKEVRDPSVTSFVKRRDLKLDGYYPEIAPGMEAVVDGVTYPIVGMDSDSQFQFTRLLLEVIGI